jgi:hypothetical protein
MELAAQPETCVPQYTGTAEPADICIPWRVSHLLNATAAYCIYTLGVHVLRCVVSKSGIDRLRRLGKYSPFQRIEKSAGRVLLAHALTVCYNRVARIDFVHETEFAQIPRVNGY